jgi:hypothetical protein
VRVLRTRGVVLRCRSKMMKQASLAVLFLTLAGCGQAPKTEQTAASVPAPAASTAAPYLLSLNPVGTTENVAFNKQPDGSSAFAANGKGFERYAVIFANGERLDTSYGNSGWLTARIPPSMYQKAGVVTIKVVNPNGKESNTVAFKVNAPK